MSKFLKSDLPAAAAILIVSVFYWLGVADVPFHPDESAHLYMAADLKLLFTNPGELIWRPADEFNLRQYYREIDPPLTRYMIGIGLAISGEQPIIQDWNWGKSWQENQHAGAMPTARQLTTARLSTSFFFPFTLLFTYLIGKKLHSRLLGWIAMALLASNALVLIHTRRAMAESILLFGILFSLWAVISWKRQRFWLAIPVAIAFYAKYSAFPLVLIGFMAVLWDFPENRVPIRKKLLTGVVFAAVFLVITAALNPFLWRTPIPALQDAFAKRQELVDRQSQTFNNYLPHTVLDTFGEKAVSLLAHQHISPPAYQDIGNYATELSSSAGKYLANPLHRLMRGWIGGPIMLVLTLGGLILMLLQVLRSMPPSRAGILVLASYLLQLVTIFIMVRFSFQRYYIPLTPYTTLFSALVVYRLIEIILAKKNLGLKQETL